MASGSTDFTVAAVPTAMNAGVWISPCGVWMVPTRPSRPRQLGLHGEIGLVHTRYSTGCASDFRHGGGRDHTADVNLVMSRPIVIATGCAVFLAAVAGCSSQDSGFVRKTGQGRVTFGPNDAGPVTSVSCETKDGLTTIGIEGKMPASVVLTEGASPAVQSVNIGDRERRGLPR